MALRLALGLLALTLGTAPAAAQQAGTTAEARDWTATVAVTAEGGWRMGNPDAAVRLVEYASISCSHCAEFNAQGSEGLRAYVRSGRVSWEFRPVMLFPPDPAIFRLMRCGDPAAAFATAHRLFAAQAEWLGRIDQKRDEIASAETGTQAATMVRTTGVDRFFTAQGMTDAAIGACLADTAALQQLTRTSNGVANNDNIDGAPTFLINGRMTEASQWRSPAPDRALETLIRAALGETR